MRVGLAFSYQLGSAHGKLLPYASKSLLAGLSFTILVVLCAMSSIRCARKV